METGTAAKPLICNRRIITDFQRTFGRLRPNLRPIRTNGRQRRRGRRLRAAVGFPPPGPLPPRPRWGPVPLPEPVNPPGTSLSERSSCSAAPEPQGRVRANW